MNMNERAHRYVDALLEAIRRQARREPALTESTWGDWIQGVGEWSDLRRALQAYYLDERPGPPADPARTTTQEGSGS